MSHITGLGLYWLNEATEKLTQGEYLKGTIVLSIQYVIII